MTLKTRFWKKVHRGAGCWIWTGTRNSNGYGILRSEGQSLRAHRLSYEFHIGQVPDGLFVCHKCDVPSCVNPDHLFLGTAKDNSEDMMRKKRNMHVTKPWTLARGDRNGTRTKPESVRRGSKIEWSRLDESEVCEIRRRFGLGETAKSLASEFGVYFGTIYNVCSRRTWKHV